MHARSFFRSTLMPHAPGGGSGARLPDALLGGKQLRKHHLLFRVNLLFLALFFLEQLLFENFDNPTNLNNSGVPILAHSSSIRVRNCVCSAPGRSLHAILVSCMAHSADIWPSRQSRQAIMPK